MASSGLSLKLNKQFSKGAGSPAEKTLKPLNSDVKLKSILSPKTASAMKPIMFMDESIRNNSNLLLLDGANTNTVDEDPKSGAPKDTTQKSKRSLCNHKPSS